MASSKRPRSRPVSRGASGKGRIDDSAHTRRVSEQLELFKAEPAGPVDSVIQVWFGRQLKAVAAAMADGRWRSIEALALICPGCQTGISARLRDLRKSKFGGIDVQRRQCGRVVEYRLRNGGYPWQVS